MARAERYQGLSCTPVSAGVARLLVTSRFRDDRATEAGVRGSAAGSSAAKAGRARGGEKCGQGRRSRAREEPEAAAPRRVRVRPQPCPAPPRPGPPALLRSRPAASRPRAPRTLLACGASRCSLLSHGSALLPGRLRRGRLRPGPHSVSLQPARERPGEWRGQPGAQDGRLHSVWGLSFLPA